jgi:DNA-binding CsgD family transcriptional regulator
MGKSMHKILGLPPEAEAVYRLILSDGPLSSATFTKPETVIIARLRAEGLVYGDKLLAATRPGLEMQNRLLRRQQAMVAAQTRMEEFEAIYQANPRHHAERTPVETLTDSGQIRRAFQHTHDIAEREVMSFLTAPYAVVTGSDGIENPHLARCRIVAELAVFQDLDAMSGLHHAHDAGCEIRMIERLPFKLLIGDGTRAMVPRFPDKPMPVVLIGPGTITDSLVAVFETYWLRALPVKSAWRNNGRDETRPTEQEITLLRHLARGATEQQIAITLGISRRTVIRRIQQLMDRAGVDTRFRLGLHAGRAGWLSDVVDR